MGLPRFKLAPNAASARPMVATDTHTLPRRSISKAGARESKLVGTNLRPLSSLRGRQSEFEETLRRPSSRRCRRVYPEGRRGLPRGTAAPPPQPSRGHTTIHRQPDCRSAHVPLPQPPSIGGASAGSGSSLPTESAPAPFLSKNGAYLSCAAGPSRHSCCLSQAQKREVSLPFNPWQFWPVGRSLSSPSEHDRDLRAVV